jgi:acyl-CoA synthetase (AMP-forming)/AMP-acid ligase II
MSGYFGDPAATREAFRGGWFHSGELGVWHPDGYIQLRDRAKAAWPARPSCSLPEHAAVLVAPPPLAAPRGADGRYRIQAAGSC